MVKLADRFVRLAGGQAIQVIAMQNGGGTRAGAGGAKRVCIKLRVCLPCGHSVRTDRGGAAGEEQTCEGRESQDRAGDRGRKG